MAGVSLVVGALRSFKKIKGAKRIGNLIKIDIFCAYVDHKLVFRLGLFLL